MLRKTLILLSFVVLFNNVFSQNVKIEGYVKDNTTKLPLVSASIVVKEKNSNETYGATTDNNGYFEIKRIRGNKNYLLTISYVGYDKYEKEIQLKDKDINLGTIFLSEEVKTLEEVKVTGTAVRAEVKGDTLQLNADAFKTTQDASAEDLVKKMPGITVESGQVKAQGEQVRKVTIDGRPFFDQDPIAALRNLPAEVVDKVQIIDEQSEQSRFTGFNDGETTKTINIVTRSNMRRGQFGKFYVGYGNTDKYMLGGNVNIFGKTSRISLIGMSNNINQQNFSMEDLIGVVSSSSGGFGGFGGGMRGGFGGGMGNISNFMVGQQPGIAKTNAFGINYSDKWFNKIEVTGSYFFNMSDNENIQLINRNYFVKDSISQTYNENNFSESKNYNHRFSLRMEYNIDSMNRIIFQPRLSFQSNNSERGFDGFTFKDGNNINSSSSNYNSKSSAISFSSFLLYMHRFSKQGRTISINLSTNINDRTGESYQSSINNYVTNFGIKGDTLKIKNESPVYNESYSARIAYTEPAGKNGQIQISYNINYNRRESDRKTYNFNYDYNLYNLLDTSLSNVFESNYLTHQAGISYRIRSNDKLNFNFGVNYESATLINDQVFPYNQNVNKTFANILPFAMMRYGTGRTNNLRLFYRTSFDPPSVTQLQNVVDYSNPLRLSTGNPDLLPSYNHRFSINYNKTNTTKGITLFTTINFTITDNDIVNQVIYANNDTTIYLFGSESVIQNKINLSRGVQLTRPVNTSGRYNFSSFISYGRPIKMIKSNLNFNIFYNYSQTPGLINNQKSFTFQNSIGGGIVLSSNISQNIDFTLSSNSIYNIVENQLNKQQNQNYFTEFLTFNGNFTILKSIVIRTDISYQLYKGLSNISDPDYILWNISIGKKLFKNQRGELRLTIFDVLKQNNSISRNVNELYVEDVNNKVIRQYAMLTFVYNLRTFQTNQNNNQQQMRQPMPPGFVPGPPPGGNMMPPQ